ncbi:hypothetical protein BDY21DRAFT_335155 [Lineolata rhizophorae]|uniref:Uncharacterized protein n=1 Tax=Lineolata rhizophorae TaxID=578093 RepID=A0A6A6P8N3_9PEZI|nr:hypothetical protein BDY21DRAFT_335155 [Lineolata rhizophorae]
MQQSPAQRRLLARLNSVAGQLVRREPTDASAAAVDAELDGIEAALAAPEPQSRPEVSDSGLFMAEDEDSDEEFAQELKRSVGANGFGQAIRELERTAGDKKFVSLSAMSPGGSGSGSDGEGRCLGKFDVIIGELAKSRRQFRDILGIFKESNQRYEDQLEARDFVIRTLCSENDALRAELEFDYRELLLLSLQLREIEQRAAPYIDPVEDKALLDSIERWRQRWAEQDDIQRANRKYFAGTGKKPRTHFLSDVELPPEFVLCRPYLDAPLSPLEAPTIPTGLTGLPEEERKQDEPAVIMDGEEEPVEGDGEAAEKQGENGEKSEKRDESMEKSSSAEGDSSAGEASSDVPAEGPSGSSDQESSEETTEEEDIDENISGEDEDEDDADNEFEEEVVAKSPLQLLWEELNDFFGMGIYSDEEEEA